MIGVPPAAQRADARVAVPVTTVWAEPGAAREADEPIVRDLPDAGVWTRGLDLEGRLGLHGRSVTQALLGEEVLVVAERDGWSEIRLPRQPSSLSDDGYPGWVPSAHLLPGPDMTAAEAALGTSLLVRAGGGAPVELSFGTRLPVAGRSGSTVILRHPAGYDLPVPSDAVRCGPAEPEPEPEPVSATDAVRIFAGTAYLWGGLSGHGVDCSGLAHLAYRSLDIVIPRDAADQEQAARTTAPDDAVPGDVVYFAGETGVHHVGLVEGPGTMLHAPRTGARVRVDRIDSPAYAGDRILIRRLLPQTTEENQ